MGPGVHLGPEVDRRAESRLAEDDRVLSEQDQLAGSGGRHRPRFPPTRLNLSGSADFRARWEPEGRRLYREGSPVCGWTFFSAASKWRFSIVTFFSVASSRSGYFVAVSRMASIAASLHTAASSAPVYLSVLRAMSSRSTSFPRGFRRAWIRRIALRVARSGGAM